MPATSVSVRDRRGLLRNIQERAIVANTGFNIRRKRCLHGQNNRQSGKTRHMPYVMPQQKKAGDGGYRYRPLSFRPVNHLLGQRITGALYPVRR